MLRLTYSIFFQQKPIKPFASATRAMALCHLRDEGAEDYAVFYSLLESCDVVQLNPLDWLTDEIIQLLPYQYKKSRE